MSYHTIIDMVIHSIEDIDTFYARIIKLGTSHGLYIPAKLVKIANLKPGEFVKIWLRSIDEIEEKEVDGNGDNNTT